MAKQPILVIMAAGMGSRYGGLKQMDGIGPAGEVILHYSIYDAMRAGFRRVVFLIKHAIEEDFRRIVAARLPAELEVRYAFQELDMLPEGFQLPEGRVKPWGTGHAVLCCRELLDAPFAVINSDDYYGPAAFQLAYDALSEAKDDEKLRWMMVGYQLSQTTTSHGHVARGVCEVSADGFLTGIHERTHIVESCDGPLFTEDGQVYHLLSRETVVSMNMWGFTPSLLTCLAESFPRFLSEALRSNPLKGEFHLPAVVNQQLEAGKASVRVLTTPDRWWGVTYHEDRPLVAEALRRMAQEGRYPEKLFG
ncbi:MAG: nucleotidyltransferase [Clostridia bacterium]|nr:nucleotidyltransferase [Clostridia bacterium]